MRYWFGKSLTDWTFDVGVSDAPVLAGDRFVTFWDSEVGGIQYTDLLDATGAPVTQVTSAAGPSPTKGTIPAFQGPDGVGHVWADAGTGVRYRMTAVNLSDGIDALGLADLADTAGAKGGGRLTYDAETAAWRTDGAASTLMGWHAALAGRHFARANVVCIGDSITEGQGITDFRHSWPRRLAQVLRARFPTDGLTGGGRGFIGALSTGASGFTWPAVVTGSPTQNTDWGPKRLSVQLDGTAPADLITYTLQGTTAQIMWSRLELGGSFRYRVDAGSWTTVATGGTPQMGGQLTTVALGASGPHTLEIESVDAGFQQFVSGIVELDGDEAKGIGVHELGHFGWSAGFWSAPYSGPEAWPSAIAALAPDLVCIMLGANDQFQGVEPATYSSQLAALIAQLRAASLPTAPSPYPPILLVMHGARGGAWPYAWPEYVAAARAVAAADPLVAILDLTLGPRIPDYEDVPNLGLYADSAHLTGRGYQYVADRVADAISPR